MLQHMVRAECSGKLCEVFRSVEIIVTLVIMCSVYAEADASRANTVTVTFLLTEEMNVGSKIGNILHNLNPTAKTTCCSLLELRPNRYLMLNSSTGDLFIRSRIDREAVCSESGVCCPTSTRNSGSISPPLGTIRVNGFSETHEEIIFPDCAIRLLILQNPVDDALVEVIVYIVDVNDNAPFWHQNLLETELPEHVHLGYMLKLPEATDMDQGPYNTVTEYKLFEAEYNLETNQILCTRCYAETYGVQNRPDTSLATKSNSPFALDVQLIQTPPSTAQKFNLHLRVQDDIDREKQSTYYFVLYAIDGREEHQSDVNWVSNFGTIDSTTNAPIMRLTGSLTIKVNVMDINDHAPEFTDPAPIVTIAESLKPGSLVYHAKATDPDVTDQTKLVYKLDISATPEVHRCFRVDPANGEVRLKNALNRHNASILPLAESTAITVPNNMLNSVETHSFGYLVPVQVSDKLHQTSVTLRVHLGQINTHPPKIHVNSHWRISHTGDQIWVPENASVDAIIALIHIDDHDVVPGRSSFSFGSPHSSGPECFTNQGVFNIQPLFVKSGTDFKLTLAQKMNREHTEKYVVKIECWDTGSPPLSSEKVLTIHVEDIDDSPPVFDRSIYMASIKEGVPPNSVILRVRATDADSGVNAQVFYRIISQSEDTTDSVRPTVLESADTFYVSIHPTTGEVYSNQVFDREVTALINCTIEASSIANTTVTPWTFHPTERPAFRALAQILITIEDVNDCKPEFSTPSYEFTVHEGQPPHTQIGIVQAEDRDAEAQNNVVKYSMRPVPGPIGQLAKSYLRISPNGVIFTQSSKLDREQTPVLSFEVVATDNGTPPLSAFASVLVRVLDVNDNSPVWLFPKRFGSLTNVNISQHATVGLQIAQLKAVDPDDGLNGEVVYSILHGNNDGIFEVDPANGALYLTKSLHYLPHTNVESVTNHQTNYTSNDGGAIMRRWLHQKSENVYQHKLVLKASDQGTPPLFNTTVLNIIVMPSTDKSTTGHEYAHPSGLHSALAPKSGQIGENGLEHRFDHDLLVIIILIALTSVISVVLIMAICLIRCRQVRSTLQTSRGELNRMGREQKTSTHCWFLPSRSTECRDGSDKELSYTKNLRQNSFSEINELGKTAQLLRDYKHASQTVASPDGERDRKETTYFTIHPTTWDTQRLLQDKQLPTGDSEAYRTMQSSVGRHSEAYAVEECSDEIAQAYSLLKCNACGPIGSPEAEYQSLSCTLRRPLKSTLKTATTSYQSTKLQLDDLTSSPLNNQQEETQALRCGSPGSSCHMCNRPSVETFLKSTHLGTKDRSSVCECTPLAHVKSQRIL